MILVIWNNQSVKMSNLSSDLMSSRPDWLRFTIVTNYGFTQTFEGKQSQSLLLSNSYGNFVLGTPSLKFLLTLFIANAMYSLAKGGKISYDHLRKRRQNVTKWAGKLWILIGQQNMFLSCVWTIMQHNEGTSQHTSLVGLYSVHSHYGWEGWAYAKAFGCRF